MTPTFPADRALRRVLRPFFAYSRPAGTHRLLSRLLKDERVEAFLAPYDLTYQVVTRDAHREVLDDTGELTEPGSVTVTVHDDEMPCSAPTAQALERCRLRPPLAGVGQERSAVDLLAALLDDPDCRAVRYLTESGVSVPELRESLREGRPLVRDDPMPPELRATRDALLGRRRYRPRELGQFWTTLMVRVLPLNPAQHPGLWARLEAGEIAARHGGRVRSDDLLLAVLTTHAVAQAHPRTTRDTQEDSDAGPVLTDAGLDHVRVRAAIVAGDLGAEGDLGKDAVPLRKQLKGFPVGTGELLRRLLAEPGNRCVRLLRQLDVDPAELSRRLAEQAAARGAAA
ncbi:hypothetical protein KIH74_11410 [Kineosporia sp. J2-2]|uniref:Uncharacterized protein n=1 Tax=Kineosporia corallincola TaxID=2835133 RepID=A0ABS5TEP4_9ACTN|nr:Clp protease N-terminal domain-containing protein [Kineosporia corallincola]MBT0769532.1 hypothetical protein [Kineosporia corallincola]